MVTPGLVEDGPGLFFYSRRQGTTQRMIETYQKDIESVAVTSQTGDNLNMKINDSDMKPLNKRGIHESIWK